MHVEAFPQDKESMGNVYLKLSSTQLYKLEDKMMYDRLYLIVMEIKV